MAIFHWMPEDQLEWDIASFLQINFWGIGEKEVSLCSGRQKHSGCNEGTSKSFQHVYLLWHLPISGDA